MVKLGKIGNLTTYDKNGKGSDHSLVHFFLRGKDPSHGPLFEQVSAKYHILQPGALQVV